MVWILRPVVEITRYPIGVIITSSLSILILRGLFLYMPVYSLICLYIHIPNVDRPKK